MSGAILQGILTPSRVVMADGALNQIAIALLRFEGFLERRGFFSQTIPWGWGTGTVFALLGCFSYSWLYTVLFHITHVMKLLKLFLLALIALHKSK